MKRGLIIAAIALGSSVVGAIGGAALYSGTSGYFASYPTELQGEGAKVIDLFNQPHMTPTAYSSTSTPQDFVEVAERSINGVVNIRSEVTINQRQSPRYIDPFEFFFGIPGNEGYPSEQQKIPTKVGLGSGVIISTDGYIITNNHVVTGASRLTVSTNDNEEYEAIIVGADPATDIALLKIDAKGLQPIPFGDSENLRVGEWVLAIGNPFNLQSTVTAGIVSAKGRSTMGQGDLQVTSFIQHDAAVNPGNSGGALVNTRGELVGINTMIYSQTGSYAGYSFAVPASIASKVVADLKRYGSVQRAILGIMGGDINSEIKKEYDLKVTEGAFIADFSNGSSARKAGIEVGDVITAINGTSIRNMAGLQEQVSKYSPGDTVEITVNRKGSTKQYKVVLKNSEGTTEIVEQSSFSSLGATFKAVDKETANQLGIRYGVKVTGVDNNGKMAEAGITKGFVILEINNSPVRSEKDIESITQQIIAKSADKVLFIKGILPNGRIRYIAVEL
ncbi:Do family serine endopeptidase [Porphyromonas levii]|uniref:Do family serine endopeptidase n=1 Tax=Porphyromonas levii TaxID=28114 RepID=UPI000363B852|nr:Do family serine endopeptidase [Porphyromonas levii]